MEKLRVLELDEKEIRRVVDGLLPQIKQLDDLGNEYAKMQADELEKVFDKIKDQSGLF